MSLDLKHIEGKNDNLSDTNDGTSGSVHDGLAGTLAESVVELVTVVLRQVITDEGLTTVLVDALKNLVCCSVSKTGEEGEEASAGGGIGLVLEDDRVKLSSG